MFEYKNTMRFVCVIYLLCSCVEWILHNKIMHGNLKQLSQFPLIGDKLSQVAEDHLNHHKNVNMDMTMKHVDKNAKGLIFKWSSTFHIAIVLFFTSYIFKKEMKSQSRLLYILSISLFYSCLWNTIHLNMHNVDYKVKKEEGMCNLKKKQNHNMIYNFLWKYHAIHHLQKGNKKNFNIVLPGFDFIMGTFQNNCYDNTEYCKTNNDIRCLTKTKCLQNENIL